MAWDKDLPSGGVAVNQGDDALRANNAALETALAKIIYFVTSGDQSGEFNIRMGNNATRDAAIPTPVVGNLWLHDGSGGGTDPHWQRWDGISAWEEITFLDSDVARIETAKGWSATQYSAYQELDYTTMAGELHWTNTTYVAWEYTLTDNRVLQNPSPSLAFGNYSSWRIEITQDGSGSHTLGFDTNFVPMGGSQPAINSAASSRSLIIVEQADNGDLLYTVRLV